MGQRYDFSVNRFSRNFSAIFEQRKTNDLMITFPNAKINLGLNIIEKRPDGYHNLETIFYPIHLQDALEVTRKKKRCSLYASRERHGYRRKAGRQPVVRAYELLKRIMIYRPLTSTCSSTSHGCRTGRRFILIAHSWLSCWTKFRLALSLEKMEDYAARLGADCAFFIPTSRFCHGHR